MASPCLVSTASIGLQQQVDGSLRADVTRSPLAGNIIEEHDGPAPDIGLWATVYAGAISLLVSDPTTWTYPADGTVHRHQYTATPITNPSTRTWRCFMTAAWDGGVINVGGIPPSAGTFQVINSLELAENTLLRDDRSVIISTGLVGGPYGNFNPSRDVNSSACVGTFDIAPGQVLHPRWYRTVQLISSGGGFTTYDWVAGNVAFGIVFVG